MLGNMNVLRQYTKNSISIALLHCYIVYLFLNGYIQFENDAIET